MSIKLKSVEDFAKTKIPDGEAVELESYSINSFLGGGLFIEADKTKAIELDGIGYKTASGKFYIRKPDDNTIHLEDIGWTPLMAGDSVPILNKIFDAAVKTGYKIKLPKAEVFVCNSNIEIPDGVTYIDGNDSTILYRNVDTNTRAKWFETRNKANNITIRNLHISYDPTDTTIASVIGFRSENRSGVKLIDCKVKSKENHTIMMRVSNSAQDYATKDVEGCVVDGCEATIRLAVQDTKKQNIVFDCDGLGAMDTYWLSNHAILPSPTGYVHRGHTIINNKTFGGRYNIFGSYINNCTIRNNKCYKGIRGIVMENACYGNTITDNRVCEVQSSSYLLSYGIHNNALTYNEAYTSIGTVQGFVQCNVDISNNRIENCKFENTSPAGMKFAIYCGINAVNNYFKNIDINATCDRSLIAIESDWIKGDTVNGYGSTTTIADGAVWGSIDSTGNTFENITLNSSSANKCNGVLLQSGGVNLTKTVLNGIKIKSSTLLYDIAAYNSGPGAITGTTLINSDFNISKSILDPLSNIPMIGEIPS